MALPTLEKTWQFQVNLQNTTDGNGTNDLRKTFLLMKNALTSMLLSPWTVAGSSNASTANMTGTDLLTVPADIVFGGVFGVNPRSWIVLEQPGLNGFQVYFGFSEGTGDGGINDGLNTNTVDVVFSPGGLFTGGTVTARPTATDEIIIGEFQFGVTRGCYWISENGSPTRQYRLHVMQSTDGKSTRIIGCHDGIVSCYISFETLGRALSSWNIPAIATVISAGNSGVYTAVMDLDSWYSIVKPGNNLTNAGSGGFWSKGNLSSPMLLKIGTEWFRNTQAMVADDFINEISNEYPMSSIGIHNVALTGYTPVSGEFARYGHLFDMWLTIPSLNTADNIPGDASKQFVVVGDFVLPWDGSSTMLIT